MHTAALLLYWGYCLKIRGIFWRGPEFFLFAFLNGVCYIDRIQRKTLEYENCREVN